MGQPNFSALNKWKQVWLAGFLQKMHRYCVPGQNYPKQLPDGPLHWETGVADCSVTFKTWLPLENFDNAEWICWQWVEMFLKKCASEVQGARKKGRWGNKWPATDVAPCAGTKVEAKFAELPNTTFMVVIPRELNCKMTRHLAINSKLCTQLWGTGRSWLISFKENCCPKEQHCLNVTYKCNLRQE